MTAPGAGLVERPLAAVDALPPPVAPRRAPALLTAPLLYLLLAVAGHLPAFSSLRTTTQCACRDAPQTDWFLAWTPYAVRTGRSPFVTDHLAVPDGVNLMWNTLLPLPGLLMAPVTATLGPLATHTLLAVLGFAGSATAMWWVAGRWARWGPARFAAGLLYGFSPYLVAQGSGHLNLTLVALPPLLLALCDELLARQRRRAVVAGALLGLVATAQLLTAVEVLASAFLVAYGALVVLLLQAGPRVTRVRVQHALVGLGTAAAVTSAFAAWPLLVQFRGERRLTGTVQDASDTYAADLLGAVVPTVHQVLGSDATTGWARNPTENGSYLGVPLLVVLAALAWRFRRVAVVRFAVAVGGLAWVLSLGERLHVGGTVYDGVPLPFALLTRVPVLGQVTAARLSLYVVLMAAVVLAVGLDRLHASGALRARRRLTAVAVLACALPLVPAWPYSFVQARTPSFFTSAAVQRVPEGAVALIYPVPRFPSSAAMAWQAEAGFRYRSVGGYVITPRPDGSGTFQGTVTDWERLVAWAAPPGTLTPTPADLMRLRAELVALDVRALLVAAGPGSDEVEVLVGLLLGRGPDERTGGVAAWYVPGR